MSEPDSKLTRRETSPAANSLVRSLVEYHWYQTAWIPEEIVLLRQFFLKATQSYPNLETSLLDDFVRLPSVPPGSNTPGLTATYLLMAGKTLSKPEVLADNLIELYGTGATQPSASSVIDCTGMTLRKMTSIAFELSANNWDLGEKIVAALQKLFFFQGVFLRDVFSSTDSFNAGGFDESTGLPDHRTTLANLVDFLANRREIQNPLALMIVHIAISHLTADASAYAENEVLFAQAADRLKLALRDTDIIGRLSRDEFLIILPQAPGAGVAALAASKVLRTLEEPFDINGRFALAKPSAGISLFPEHGQEAETLLHHAEIAREEARQLKQHYAIYDEEFHRQSREQRSLETKLRTAIQEDQLELYFQPQADIRTGKIVGAESLLRWHAPGGSYVPPHHIISVAEESGLIFQLTIWVFNTSLRHCANLAKTGIDINVSVNVTASDLAHPELVDIISQALSTWNVPAHKLIIELTEGSLIRDSEGTINTLDKIRSMGVALSLDDFGTGYSSMKYLKKMPLDELKIDLVFVQNMLSSKEDERIVRSIIDLAHHFDLKVVGEGVEDRPTLEFLEALGCDIVQGYFIAKPLPIAEFSDWWAKNNGLLPGSG